MASTITPATMTVTVSESVTLNGVNQGGTQTLSIPLIATLSKRIVDVPTAEVEIIAMSTAVAAGTFIESDVMYIRITNLNDTAGEGVNLQIARDDDSNGTDDECTWFLLEEGKSFILNTFDAAFDAAAGDLDSPSLDAITDIRALNESGSVAVDLEIFIAST